MHTNIIAYNQALDPKHQKIAELLATEIQAALPCSTNKVWHGAPVWFINDNPIVGYDSRKNSVHLLFWSGQSFDEPGLTAEGKFKAAGAHYSGLSDINLDDLQRWLKKSQDIQWDYKNIVKRKGVLERLA